MVDKNTENTDDFVIPKEYLVLVDYNKVQEAGDVDDSVFGDSGVQPPGHLSPPPPPPPPPPAPFPAPPNMPQSSGMARLGSDTLAGMDIDPSMLENPNNAASFPASPPVPNFPSDPMSDGGGFPNDPMPGGGGFPNDPMPGGGGFPSDPMSNEGGFPSDPVSANAGFPNDPMPPNSPPPPPPPPILGTPPPPPILGTPPPILGTPPPPPPPILGMGAGMGGAMGMSDPLAPTLPVGMLGGGGYYDPHAEEEPTPEPEEKLELEDSGTNVEESLEGVYQSLVLSRGEIPAAHSNEIDGPVQFADQPIAGQAWKESLPSEHQEDPEPPAVEEPKKPEPELDIAPAPIIAPTIPVDAVPTRSANTDQEEEAIAATELGYYIRLRPRESLFRGATFKERRIISIGRDNDQDIYVEHDLVGATHAEIEFKNNQYFEIAPVAGHEVIVNGEVLRKPHALCREDEITLVGPGGPSFIVEMCKPDRRPGTKKSGLPFLFRPFSFIVDPLAEHLDIPPLLALTFCFFIFIPTFLSLFLFIFLGTTEPGSAGQL